MAPQAALGAAKAPVAPRRLPGLSVALAVLPAFLALPAAAAEEDCKWPHCVPRCPPCVRKQVGSCRLSFIHASFGCKAHRGPTDCYLGRCLCGDGYCASQSGDYCEPQVCYPGADPPPFNPSIYVRVLSWLANGRFPPPQDLKDEPMQAFLDSLAGPIALLFGGLIVALGTCAGLSCGTCRQCCRERCCPKREEDSDEAPRRGRRGYVSMERPRKRPSCVPMFVSAFLVMSLSLMGIAVRQTTYFQSARIIKAELMRAHSDLVVVAEQSAIVNRTCRVFEQNLLAVPWSCKTTSPTVTAILVRFSALAQDAVAKYTDQVEQFADAVQPLPENVALIERVIDTHQRLVVWIPLVPLFVVSAMCALIVAEAVSTTCCRSSRVAYLADCGLQLSALVFASIIALVAVMAAIELWVGTEASQFCVDVDRNVLSYIDMATGPNLTDLSKASRYYIAGDTYNPILEYEEAARKYIDETVAAFRDARDALAIVGYACPSFSNINLHAIASEAHGVLDQCHSILETAHIYPYYREVVRRGMCGSVIASVTLLLILQVAGGLVGFPVCAILTHRFLRHLAAWKEAATTDVEMPRENRSPHLPKGGSGGWKLDQELDPGASKGHGRKQHQEAESDGSEETDDESGSEEPIT